MSQTPIDRLSFHAEWYHEEAAIVRPYVISYHSIDNSIDVFDQKTKKVFLRRTTMPDLSEGDFFLGSKINIFGRQFDLIDYADEMTRKALAKYRKSTFILVKSFIMKQLGEVLCAFIESNFSISKAMMASFSTEQVKAFMGEENRGDSEVAVLMNELLAGPCVGFEIVADDAINKVRSCRMQAKECNTSLVPGPLVDLFQKEEIRKGIYSSATEADVIRELAHFFDVKSNIRQPCTLKNSTLGIVKPHCIKEGNLGKIISEILKNGFKIMALRTHLLERVNCEELYEVYRGILPDYMPMVGQLASGVCMALEIMSVDEKKDSYKEFRLFCGPMDPEIAKLLRPHTLRAKFGTNRTLNAIHCTDLPDDTVIELQYMFKILD